MFQCSIGLCAFGVHSIQFPADQNHGPHCPEEEEEEEDFGRKIRILKIAKYIRRVGFSSSAELLLFRFVFPLPFQRNLPHEWFRECECADVTL